MASYVTQIIEITRNHPVGVTVAVISCIASVASYFGFLRRNQCKVHMSALAKPGLVVLHAMGPTRTIVNSSPFVLKLQTFLRMANIEFVHDLKHPFDRKHKMPWIELDGKVYSDSTFIIEFLTKRFNVKIDNHLDDKQKALARVISKTIEENTFW